jgi:hypothetical protein
VITFFRNFLDQFRRTQAVLDELKAPAQDLPGGHRQWIEDSMDWLVGEFGRDVLLRPVVLPAELLAGYDGTEEAARSLFAELCERMDVPLDRVELRFDLADGIRPTAASAATQPETSPPPVLRKSGRWVRAERRSLISIAPELLGDPVPLVWVLAHELGHELLIGFDRIEASRPDQESLTDLLTVFYGFGIFTANASFEWTKSPTGRGKRAMARGYLREEALADALAHYCLLRGERPSVFWQTRLDWPVRLGLIARLNHLLETREAEAL